MASAYADAWIMLACLGRQEILTPPKHPHYAPVISPAQNHFLQSVLPYSIIMAVKNHRPKGLSLKA